MRLVVVYGLKTRDYRWLEGFYPAKRLCEECENRGVELRFLFPRDVEAFLDNPSDAKRGETAFLTRGDISRKTVEHLEATGRPCVNGSVSREIANDKLETYRFLASHGFPTPKTLLLDEPFSTPSRDLPVFPLVIKPRFGSRGTGVALCQSMDDIIRAMGPPGSRIAGEHGGWIAQEFVAHSRGRDLRMLFAGGEILAIAERRAHTSDFRSNTTAGGSFKLATDTPRHYLNMALDIANAAGLWYGSIDWLYLAPGDLTVCEINASPGFEALERDCGINVAGGFVDQLLRTFT